MTTESRLQQNGEPQKTPFERHYKAGLDALNAGDGDKATKKFLQAAVADPEKWCAAAIEIGRTGNPDMAMACLSELLKSSKAAIIQSGAWCAIGNVYSNAGKRNEAHECFVKSWDLNPHPGSASNRALIHLWNGEIDDAERWIKRSLDMNPWLPEVQFVQSMITLVGRGHYRPGFRQYECRWRSKETGLRKLPSNKPEWPGPESNKGNLLVYGEQGMGDTILALRYAKLIHELGLKQIWCVQPQLRTLVEASGLVDEVKVPGDQFHEYDFHIPALSLPRCFGTSLENVPPAPYLPHDVLTFNRADNLKIGICWKGSSVNRNNEIRSAPLEEWSPILDLSPTFYSFQVDGALEAIPYRQIRMNNWNYLKDWKTTAAEISKMDLVISVDTALVHLAGAMGIPCWCALHCRPYFVYPLKYDHSTPWYPSVRLFRQKKEHEWKPVFERIAEELKKLL